MSSSKVKVTRDKERITVELYQMTMHNKVYRVKSVLLQFKLMHFVQLHVCLQSPYVIGQTIYIFILFLLSFFSSPNLSGRRLDVCHTSTHGVALVRIQNAGLKCAARGSLKIQKMTQKIAIYGHPPTILSGYIFATEACIDNRKPESPARGLRSSPPACTASLVVGSSKAP